jgi:hypothetical protein
MEMQMRNWCAVFVLGLLGLGIIVDEHDYVQHRRKHDLVHVEVRSYERPPIHRAVNIDSGSSGITGTGAITLPALGVYASALANAK